MVFAQNEVLPLQARLMELNGWAVIRFHQPGQRPGSQPNSKTAHWAVFFVQGRGLP